MTDHHYGRQSLPDLPPERPLSILSPAVTTIPIQIEPGGHRGLSSLFRPGYGRRLERLGRQFGLG